MSPFGSKKNDFSRIIFFHVPKCAGSTVYASIRNAIGRRSLIDRLTGRSRSVLLHTVYHSSTIGNLISKARRASFVHGHFDWATYGNMECRNNDFLFTFLREPVSRLISSYNFFCSEQGWIYADLPGTPQDYDFEKYLEVSIQQNAWAVDNIMVRMFSGRFDANPQSDADWIALVDQASRRVSEFDFVGFHENFENDFKAVIHKLGFGGATLLTTNTTKKNRVDLSQVSASQDVVSRCTKWDDILYHRVKETGSK